MDWRKERDALIEQTFAFVQSVTGRIEETARRQATQASMTPVSPPPEASAVLEPIQAAPVDANPIEALPVETAPFATGPADPAPAALVQPVEALQGAVLSSPAFRSGVKDEIQARIDGFRAHQDRFRRERAEYCSATLQRLRATIEVPLPPGGQISQPSEALGQRSSPRPATNASETPPGSRSSGNAQGPS